MLLGKVFIVSVQKNTSQFGERYSQLYHYTHANTAQDQETPGDTYKRFHTAYLKKRGVITTAASSSVLSTVVASSNPSNEKNQRDILQKAESLLFAHFPLKIINKQWNEFKVLLDDLSILVFTLNENSGVQQLAIERGLVAPSVLSSSIASAALTDSFLVGTIKQQSQLTLIQPKQPSKKPVNFHDIKKPSDIQVTNKEAGGTVLKVILNSSNELLLVVLSSVFQFYRVAADRGTWNISNQPILEVPVNPKVCCKFSTSQPFILLTFEERTQSVCYAAWKFDEQHNESADLDIRSPITCVEDSITGPLILCGCKNGSLYLFDSEGVEVKTPQKEICCIRWHPTNSAIIAVCDETAVFFMDNNLNLLTIKLELDHITTSLSIVDHLSFNARLRQTEWLLKNDTRKSTEGLNMAYDNLVVVFDRGPIVIVRLEFGGINKGSASSSELVAQYVASNQIIKAIQLLATIKNVNEMYLCYALLVNHLLRQDTYHFDVKESLEYLLSDSMRSQFSRFPKYASKIEQYFTRYCHIHLIKGDFEKSFRIADAAHSASLFKDVSTWSKYNKQYVMADLARTQAESLVDRSSTNTWDKQIIGVSAIQEYMEALEVSYAEGEVLSSQDCIRLGLWFENQGKFDEALNLYYSYEMLYELKRLKDILAIMNTS